MSPTEFKSSPPVRVSQVLTPDEWGSAERVHRGLVDAWSMPRLARRQRGEKHPVDDFLWEYYPVRPGQLRLWSPGVGIALGGDASAFLERRGFRQTPSGVSLDPSLLPYQAGSAPKIAALLIATASRPGRFGCFALHEWAMVYGLSQEEVRHRAWPLRLNPSEVRDVVDEVGLRCTHFDAFRFYTEQARPLNPLQLTRDSQKDAEQPGCLHANMDLFKWAWQLFPLTSSELVRATREFAADVREVDMQAAPYDLTGLGIEPIRVETAEGRAEFAVVQKELADRATALRTAVCDAALHIVHLLGDNLP